MYSKSVVRGSEEGGEATDVQREVVVSSSLYQTSVQVCLGDTGVSADV